jgi:hypothetical protein
MFSIQLNGKNKINEITLKGKSNYSSYSPSIEIQKFKQDFLAFFILPLLNQEWQVLTENLFFLSKFKTKLYKLGSSEDLILYFDIFSILEIIAEEHKQRIDIEKRLNQISSSKDQFLTFVYKTKRIKLLPEYEIYDSILGKPLRDKNQQYNLEIIQMIKELLQKEKINFQIIKESVLQMFENFITKNS